MHFLIDRRTKRGQGYASVVLASHQRATHHHQLKLTHCFLDSGHECGGDGVFLLSQKTKSGPQGFLKDVASSEYPEVILCLPF
jgi:hypothetical protein